ncbi:Eukaryotic porin [Nitzschia inconspicua]|uniref:Eukaryotic porin n=1 Tax=Nitzschia inconspicua TaxID=303405 RepID=A0A9K3LLM1_9STRA|nr:Eukaryotic porin [Nitzschia inconspicua]
MATKFADIAKAPKDLLNDDYTTKQTLKCKKNAGPVAVTIETERGEGGALSSKIGTKFAYAKFNVDKAQATANGGHVLETSLNVAPNMKLSFKAGKGADLGIDYTQGNFYATGVLDVIEMSKFSTSACISLPSGIKAGGDATYGLSGKTGLTALNVGASYAHGPIFASATSSSKFSSVTLGLTYQVNPAITLASLTSHSSDKICDVNGIGGSYKADFGTIKAKYSAGGVVSAAFIKDIAPKVTLTASGSAAVSDFSTFKYGVGIAM